MTKFIRVVDMDDVPWVINVRRIIAVRPGGSMGAYNATFWSTIYLNEGTKVVVNKPFRAFEEFLLDEEDK